MSIRKPFDINFLASQLQAARLPQGGVEAFRSREVLAVLLSAFQWRDDVPKAERGNLIWNAIRSVPQSQILTGQVLPTRIEAAQRNWLRKSLRPGILVVSLSMQLPIGITTKRLQTENMVLSRRLPSLFRQTRSDPRLNIPADDVEPVGYTSIRAKALGRSIHDRYEKAMNAVDLVRAKWNLAINRRVLTRFESGPFEPINRFRLSRIHTLHNPDGSSQFKNYWYDPTFFAAARTGVMPSEWKTMQVERRRIGQRLSGHPYQALLERALIRYTRALDTADFESAFLKLWSLLELLSASGGNNYDVTIRRVRFLFRDRDLAKQVLEHLRQQRNISVHEENWGDIRGLAWQLKLYVEQLILLHLSLGRTFKSIDEAAQFLDQPTTTDALKRRAWLSRRAIEFLK